uniref:Histone deacetylase 14 n=1 Tax=Tanacetum cinerariifolium TaxID=118510 RepID=A0A6L2N8C1_TANCI|nr:hypothetical protein [Tanacetum cinerariifolium]
MTGVYRFQLDEQWFTLTYDILCDALEITPVNPANPFISPLAGEIVMDFVNELGYPEEEFIQGIQTFFTHRDSNKIPSKKPTPHVILYCQFTKLIIYYLGSKYDIHRRLESPRHVTGDEFLLGNLKFIPKGEKDEVFRMPIPKESITEAIQSFEYYKQYVEMTTRKVQAKEVGKKKTAPKADKSMKPAPAKQSKPATAKQPKPKLVKEKSAKPTPPQKAGKGKENDVERAIQMSLESFQTQGQTHVGGVAIREPVAEATRPLPVVKGKGKAIATEDDASANIVRDSLSPAGSKTGADTDKTNSEDDIEILQIDPGKTPESRPPSKRGFIEEDQAGPDPGLSHVALAGPDPEPMHDDFVAIMYPQVHESLKHPHKEHAQVENPLSSTGTLSSMKNLEAYTFATTTTKKTTTLPPPPQNQGLSVPDLASRVSTLEQVCDNFKKRYKLQDNTIQGISSRVFTLEHRDLPHKINQTVNEVVKEAVHVVFQSPLRDLFRELSKADMKEILHQRMFENGSYKSLPEHVALYEALEVSMERANQDEFLAKKTSLERDQFAPHSEQPVKDVPIADDVNISDLEDTDVAHLPKIKTSLDWLKLVPEEDIPETSEPD